MRDLVNYYIFLLAVFTGAGIRISNGQKASCTKNSLLGTSVSWKCTERKKCAFIIPKRNTVVCDTGKICCPEPRPASVGIKTGLSTGSSGNTPFQTLNAIAKKKCEQYRDYIYNNYTIENPLLYEPRIPKYEVDCVQIETLIVGGEDARPKEFPFMALLGYDDEPTVDGNWLCGGTLISDKFILSAAHCTKDTRGELVKWAALGLRSRVDIPAAEKNNTIFRIKERYNHPLYKAGGSTYENNDIALYELESSIKLSPLVRPVCLYYHNLKFNAQVYVTGWGKLMAGGVESDILQKAVINHLDPKECVEPYANDPFLKKGFDRQTMICGGHLTEAKDTCSGDSGGPMLVPIFNNTCMMVQVGITSRGPAYCGGNTPAIYTRVSMYLQWIQKIVWPNEKIP